MIPLLISWSGGKDSMMTLERILTEHASYQVKSLFTTICWSTDTVPIHEVPRYLMEQQANSLGFRLKKVFIPPEPTNQEYEERLTRLLMAFKKQNVTTIAFGDLFLEDIRQYRETFLQKVGFQGMFPLWKQDTKKIAEEFIERGYKAIITTVDTTIMNDHFAGQLFTWDVFDELPDNVDPCGENGEFHTFVFDGPMFKTSVKFRIKKKILLKDRFSTVILRY